MRKKFLKFVLPSMLAFAFSGVYAIVDGFFVGRSTGDVGLAAINIAYPIQALVLAIGTGIGMGGAVMLAHHRGGQNEEEEQRALGGTIGLLCSAMIVLIPLLLLFRVPILELLGASGAILVEAEKYIRVVIGAAMFQFLATALTPVLRSYEEVMVSMYAMIVGFVTNIVLDALFVMILDYGIMGAACATVIGQAVTLIPCLHCLWKQIRSLHRRQFRYDLIFLKKTIKIGLSPFGLSMCPNVILIFMNKSALQYGGDEAVAAYAVVAYVMTIIQLLIQGVSDGSQPLIGIHLGKEEKKEARHIRNIAYEFAVGVAILCFALIWLLRHQVPAAFGVSDQAGEIVASALPILMTGAVCIAFLRVTISYFYSTHYHIPAYILVYGEPIGLALLLLFVFPPIFGLNGVWTAAPAIQAILTVIGVFFLLKQNDNSR